MTWTIITDAELSSGKPIKASQGRHLRDNVTAAFNGDAGAPQMNRAAISPGSSGIDLHWVDATVITGLGFFEPQDIAVTVSLALPGVSIVRVNGNVTIAAGATLNVAQLAASGKVLGALEGQIAGNDGILAATSGLGGAGQSISGANRFWNRMRGFMGGKGGDTGAVAGGNGGGVLILIINGNLTIGAGGSINANGADAAWSGATHGGGGAGGTLIVVCAGTLSGGAFNANGGNGWDGVHGPGGGGGGGGYVALIASAYGTAPTMSATGGTHTNAGGTTNGGGGGSVGAGGDGVNGAKTDGAAGFTEQITLTQPQINSLMLRSY